MLHASVFLLLFARIAAGPISGGFVDEAVRVDCFPEPGATQDACTSRGCIWDEASSKAPAKTPWCYYPTESGYTIQTRNERGIVLKSKTPNPYGTNISPLDVRYRKNGATLLVTIGNDDRYVPPVNLPQAASTSSESLNFDFGTIGTSDIFYFTVKRASTGVSLWDTSIGGMQFADKFIQIATYLPSKNVYGFGDHVHKRMKV
ncbi:unnamed protein product [Caenorhabditis bovis]|uniref:P-type domain-containing protein n=1 Tax=Caenorhabditis bovis TaxID=2654633 RepID=A0A8S1F398_9PELO|nr:unnamed protein product [Caenorhabditis bovis]